MTCARSALIAVLALFGLAAAGPVPAPLQRPGVADTAEPDDAALPRPAQRPLMAPEVTPFAAPSPETASPAASDKPAPAPDDLSQIERDLAERKARAEALEQEAARISAESGDLQGRSIAAAAAVREKEQAIALSEDNLDLLAARETEMKDRLQEERARLSETLAALQMLERQRPPAIAVSPGDATQAVRSAMLLADLVPRLREQAEALSGELDQLRKVRTRILEEQAALTAAAEALKDDQARLDLLMAAKARQREELAGAMSDETARIAEIAKRASDLSGLISDLGEETARAAANEKVIPAVPPAGTRPAEGLWASPGSAPRQFADARGTMKFPVIGKVVEKFGVPNESGGLTKGIKIAPRPGSPVVMPFDARVKYAGPLKVFGKVLIAEAGDDYLIILAGFSSVDALVGQWLLAGEPVGRMARDGEDGPTELYIEFRKSREPIDPLPWLAGVTQEG